MKISFWKNLLSYFTDFHIESVQSDFNQNLHLYLSKGRYQLCTDNAIYSYGDLYDNYRDSFKKINLNKFDNADILVLGFGMGSIPFMLEKKFGLRAVYTGVEIDPDVIRLASGYILPDIKSSIEIIESDVLLFLHWNDRKFDLIASDIFIDDKIPDQYLSIDYLYLLKEHLKQTGCIMLNMLYKTEIDKALADRFYSENFKMVFPDSVLLKVRNNVMLISDKVVMNEYE